MSTGWLLKTSDWVNAVANYAQTKTTMLTKSPQLFALGIKHSSSGADKTLVSVTYGPTKAICTQMIANFA